MGPSVKSQGNMFVASGPDNKKVPEFLLISAWNREFWPLKIDGISNQHYSFMLFTVFHFFCNLRYIIFFFLLPGDAKDAGWGEGLGLGLHWRLLPEWCLLQANG